MSLMAKTNKKQICSHIAQVMKLLHDLNIGMEHDHKGTWLYCRQCGNAIWLEAYGDKIIEGDIPEDK